MRWSRLTSFEDLVGFRSLGLQYTTTVRIVTQHGPVKYSQCGLVHRDLDEIDVSYTAYLSSLHELQGIVAHDDP